MIKARVNPVTGKAETYEDSAADAAQEKLKRTRRELRDMLDGNMQFHDDPLKAPTPEEKPDESIKGDGTLRSGGPFKVGDYVHSIKDQRVSGTVQSMSGSFVRIRRDYFEDYHPDDLSKLPGASAAYVPGVYPFFAGEPA